MTRCKPFLKWAGGKTRLLPELRRRMPKTYGRYFEPFMGGGALFFEVQPPRAYLADANEELMNAFRVVRDQVEELVQDLSTHVYEKEYFYRVRNADRLPEYDRWTPVQRASRLIYLNKTCFNGLYRVNSKGQFNVPFGRYKNPTILDVKNLRLCSRALRDAEIACEPFESIEQAAETGDFVYFDPPYAPSSSTANFTAYGADGFDESRQHELKRVCDRLDEKGVRVMLSNSFTELTQDLYKHYTVQVVSAARAINARADKRGQVSEMIVTNYWF